MGSNIPTFEAPYGDMLTFPLAKRTPPTNADAPVFVITFEYARVAGLNTPMFESPVEDDGNIMTFPFGANTPPRNFPAPEAPTVAELETVGGFVNGLY